MTQYNNSDDLFTYLVSQQCSGAKNWFGFQQQRIAGIYLAYKIAERHAPHMTPEECADYAFKLNNAVYTKLVKGE